MPLYKVVVSRIFIVKIGTQSEQESELVEIPKVGDWFD